MIRIGLDAEGKRETVARYVAEHAIRHVVVFHPSRFKLDYPVPSVEHVEWDEIIMYRTYYRLLQEVGRDTLLVLDECLRSQDRHCLTYNCLRLFLAQTTHPIVLQRLPIIDGVDDVATLVDFDTRSRWKRDKVRPEIVRDLDVQVVDRASTFEAVPVPVTPATRAAYAREKAALFDGLGLKDPHTIPRTLHLVSGKAKLPFVGDRALVGRNDRLKLERMTTYREVSTPEPRTVFEFCHNAIDFSDFLSVTGQTHVEALVADLPVERWYFDRFTSWAGRVRDGYAVLRG